MNRALLLLGGEAPSIALTQKMAAQCEYVLCADSGLAAAMAANLRVDAAIGDFDSADAASIAWMQENNIPHIVYPTEKDDTDGMACVRALLKKKPASVVLLGACGGRIDHYLANLQMLLYLEKNGVSAVIEQEEFSVCAVQGKKEISGNPGELLSVVQMAEDTVLSLSGLHYPLDHYPMEIGYPIGISNVLSQNVAHIEVHKGWVLVIHYHHA